jgi:hypothetical protein
MSLSIPGWIQANQPLRDWLSRRFGTNNARADFFIITWALWFLFNLFIFGLTPAPENLSPYRIKLYQEGYGHNFSNLLFQPGWWDSLRWWSWECWLWMTIPIWLYWILAWREELVDAIRGIRQGRSPAAPAAGAQAQAGAGQPAATGGTASHLLVFGAALAADFIAAFWANRIVNRRPKP